MMGLVSLSLFYFFLKGNLESSWEKWLGLVFPAKWKNRFAKKAKFFVFSRNNAKFRDWVSWGERITDKFTLGFCYFKLVSFFGND